MVLSGNSMSSCGYALKGERGDLGRTAFPHALFPARSPLGAFSLGERAAPAGKGQPTDAALWAGKDAGRPSVGVRCLERAGAAEHRCELQAQSGQTNRSPMTQGDNTTLCVLHGAGGSSHPKPLRSRAIRGRKDEQGQGVLLPLSYLWPILFDAASDVPALLDLHSFKIGRQGGNLSTDELWLRFYAGYPRKVAKAAAEKAWNKLTLPERQQALDALPNHVRYWRQKATEWEFICHPASWINAKRFLDELPNHGGALHQRTDSSVAAPPPFTGPAATVPLNGTPPHIPSLAAVPAGGADPVRLNGPRPLSDVFRDLKSKIGVKG